MPPSGIAPGAVVCERYVIEHVIGKGGMGVVVAARDSLIGRRVALKFVLPQLAHSKTAVERFLREARSVARLSSEHVAQVLDVRTLAEGVPVIVMEYLEGQDLHALLNRQGPLPVERAIDYLLQALEAIAEGHSKGIIHRDIKPNNLFLTRRVDGTALIKVLDFGVAKVLDEGTLVAASLTSTQDGVVGSPFYMSPEQLRSLRELDERADIWAVGVTLYELLTGFVPFRATSYAGLIAAIASEAPEPPTRRRRDLPAGLELALMGCLEKERERRIPSVAALAARLAPFGTDEARVSLARIARTALPAPVAAAVSPGPSSEASVRTTTGNTWGSSGQRARRARPRGRAALIALGIVAGGAMAAVPLMRGEPRVPALAHSVASSLAESAPTALAVSLPNAPTVSIAAQPGSLLVKPVSPPSAHASSADLLNTAPASADRSRSLPATSARTIAPSPRKRNNPAPQLPSSDPTLHDVEAQIDKGR